MLGYLREQLQESSQTADLIHGDMTKFTLDQPVDAAYSMVNSFRYLLTEEDARAHLQCVAHSLRPGGLYLIAMHLLPPDASKNRPRRGPQKMTWKKLTSRQHSMSSKPIGPARLETLQINLLVRKGR